MVMTASQLSIRRIFVVACLRRSVIVGARPVRPKALGPDEDGTAKAEFAAGVSIALSRRKACLCWSDSEGLVRPPFENFGFQRRFSIYMV
jgi:hypothetical protein